MDVPDSADSEKPDESKSSVLGGLDPGELLARALDSVKISGGAHGWSPPSVEEVGKLFPAYRVERLIGRGGMGAVYQAVQLNLDRLVAIKLLPVELTTDQEFVARFEREARTLARLQHSRIVTIYEFGRTEEGHLYFTMEYIDGTDLRTILRGPGLEPDQALAVVEQLCNALQAAHQVGVVHRDIKPENVLITSDGYVKLADFGLARAPQKNDASNFTRSDLVLGTPDYMAPEQHFGAIKADARSDIFALGVLLYEMLTGQPPRGVFEPPSRKVQVDVRIDEVVLKALQAEPARRYQKASDLKTDVERIRSTPRPVVDPPKVSPPPAQNVSVKKRPAWPWLAAAAGLLALAGVIGLLSVERKRAPQQPPAKDEASVEAPPAPLASLPLPLSKPPEAKFSDYSTGFVWQNRLVGNELEPANFPGWRDSNGNITPQVGAHVTFPGEVKDSGVRLRFRADLGPTFIDIFARSNSGSERTAHYNAVTEIGPPASASIRMSAVDKSPERGLTDKKFDKALDGAEHTLEFYTVGQRLTYYLDGQLVLSAEDGALSGGRTGLLMGPWIHLLNVETASRSYPEAAAKGASSPVDSSTVASAPPVDPNWRIPALNEASFGGFNLIGDPALAYKGDSVLLTSRSGRSGFVGGKGDFSKYNLHLELAGTGDVHAWVGVRVASQNEEWRGYTSHISGRDGEVFIGHAGRNFTTARKEDDAYEHEGGMGKVGVPAGSFFSLDFELDDKGGLRTVVNGQWTSTVVRNVSPTGHVGIFIDEGSLRIRKIEIRERSQISVVQDTPPPVKAAPAASPAPPGEILVSKIAPFVNSIGMRFVPIMVNGRKLYFSVWPTRVKDFEAYARATGAQIRAAGFPQTEDHPVASVTWDEAGDFCRWLSRQEGMVYRLPTDVEWSWAAGIGQLENPSQTPADKTGKIPGFVWGTAWPPPPGAGNFGNVAGYEDGFPFTSPVGQFSPTKDGLYDMCGNVWQWCDDTYEGEADFRVARGGAWNIADPNVLRISYRLSTSPDARFFKPGDQMSRGFRVVLDTGGNELRGKAVLPPSTSPP